MKNRFFLILSFYCLQVCFHFAAQNGFTVSGIVMTEQGEELPVNKTFYNLSIFYFGKHFKFVFCFKNFNIAKMFTFQHFYIYHWI